MFADLVKKTRSVRRFAPLPAVTQEDLAALVDIARLTPSAANLQPLRYMPVTSLAGRDAVFSCLHWAGYLSDWQGPAEGERPTGYLLLLSDPSRPAPAVDTGIAAQTLLLAAAERGLGGCMLGAIDRERLASRINLGGMRIELVLALGAPAEQVVLEPVREGNIRYFRDEAGVHHVPKRALCEVLLPECKILS